MSGDLAYTFDFDTGIWITRPIAVLHEQKYDGVFFSIAFDDGMSLTVTEDHPIWVVEGQGIWDRNALPKMDALVQSGKKLPGRWVNSNDLRIGDQLVGLHGKVVRVAGIIAAADTRQVYDLTVLGCHYYTVGNSGILVHNSDTPNAGSNKPSNGPTDGKGAAKPVPKEGENLDEIPVAKGNPARPPSNKGGWSRPRSVQEALREAAERGAKQITDEIRKRFQTEGLESGRHGEYPQAAANALKRAAEAAKKAGFMDEYVNRLLEIAETFAKPGPTHQIFSGLPA